MSLIDEIKSGSKEAIKQVYQENAQDVYSFAKGITGNHDTAMQATKNTFAKLFKQIQEGQETGNLHSAALKLAYDEACKIAMPAAAPVVEEAVEETPAPAPAPAPAKAAKEVKEKAKPARREAAPAKKQKYVEPEEDYDDDDYDDYDDYDDDDYDDYDDDYDEAPRRGFGFVLCLFINIILVLLLIWFVIGLLSNLSVIPNTIDLGYSWFNAHVYPLF